ncbi:alpha/beta-hydrolase [Punctularia strigosozonata HHB-11173 SS5]|uniref:alpha/beta-hydrolase n=1 Tax=Punctularia strigosozonata (strain HHB-11173) TaxID=741275 RepID=UPI0004417D94|nr:alpha/beta-hydrolase [Punctularia strigosozonata HHB-11173 SS5]EIN09843.1 alpha/beta-hydrolase [Punctularia strigosozonata HHB-11173 SS5]
MASVLVPSNTGTALGGLEGTPRGTQTHIGPFDTYVAQPPVQKGPAPAVVVFYDQFGFKIPNARLISDMLAEKTGLTVYCPDIFAGDGVSPDGHSVVAVDSESHHSLIEKLSEGFHHHPKAHASLITDFLTVLKHEHGRLAAIGYGCGGKHAVHFISSGVAQLKASVVCHPSHVSFDDISQIEEPVSFVCAEHDHAFDKATRENAEQFLVVDQHKDHPGGFSPGVTSASPQDGRPAVRLSKDFEAQFVVYPGTVHGFAIRPDLSNPETRKAFEGALDQSVAFLKKHLQV